MGVELFTLENPCPIINSDISKIKFSRLMAIKPVGRIIKSNGSKGHIVWEFLCDCGEVVRRPATKVKFGSTKSCGCLLREGQSRRKYSKEDSSWRFLWNSHKRGALSRGISYLSFETFKEWLIQNPNCIHCSAPPEERKQKSGKAIYSHGIDRIDSSFGYMKGNIQTSCSRCNSAKSNSSDIDFWRMCNEVARRHPIDI